MSCLYVLHKSITLIHFQKMYIDHEGLELMVSSSFSRDWEGISLFLGKKETWTLHAMKISFNIESGTVLSKILNLGQSFEWDGGNYFL